VSAPSIDEAELNAMLVRAGLTLTPDQVKAILPGALIFQGLIARVSGCYSAPPQPHMRDSHMTCVLRGNQGASQADYYDLRYSTHFKGEGCVQYDMEHQAPYYFRFGGRGHHAGEYQHHRDRDTHYSDNQNTNRTQHPGPDSSFVALPGREVTARRLVRRSFPIASII